MTQACLIYISSNDLPRYLGDKLEVLADTGVDPTTLRWICCAFGPENSYIFVMKHKDSIVIYHEDLPPSLEAWLFDPTSGAHLRDGDSLKVTLGECDSFFAMDKNGYRWDGLPSKLEGFIQAGFKPNESDVPRLVALGKDQSFVLVTTQGGIYVTARPKLVESVKGLGGEISVCLANLTHIHN